MRLTEQRSDDQRFSGAPVITISRTIVVGLFGAALVVIGPLNRRGHVEVECIAAINERSMWVENARSYLIRDRLILRDQRMYRTRPSCTRDRPETVLHGTTPLGYAALE